MGVGKCVLRAKEKKLLSANLNSNIRTIISVRRHLFFTLNVPGLVEAAFFGLDCN